ncbi:hypothetical protein MI170_18825 [Mycolicibacterium goodii]|uniref:hypothetical protein n=1 Tax=Mycolicibacterium goodii TaxID=134601 RepID=UPI00217DD32A|nr:hypothetical protein [Mycolicibacterium goodii]UVI51803.1 hypothetical protein MI170_18825 [Mycolicibacterium goodii]
MAEATLRGVDLTIAHVITPLSASTLLWPGDEFLRRSWRSRTTMPAGRSRTRSGSCRRTSPALLGHRCGARCCMAGSCRF